MEHSFGTMIELDITSHHYNQNLRARLRHCRLAHRRYLRLGQVGESKTIQYPTLAKTRISGLT